MNLSTLLAATAACMLAASGASAQNVEAARYRNAQGVEILVNRAPAQDAPAAPTKAPQRQSQPATAAAAIASEIAAAAPARAAQRVDERVQVQRDEDRQHILLSELLAEGEMLESKRRKLKHPRAAFELSSEELRKLGDEVQRHDANVKALNRELALVRAPGARARAGS
jgi:hypothetical protein